MIISSESDEHLENGTFGENNEHSTPSSVPFCGGSSSVIGSLTQKPYTHHGANEFEEFLYLLFIYSGFDFYLVFTIFL